jgi:hypothetical protein
MTIFIGRHRIKRLSGGLTGSSKISNEARKTQTSKRYPWGRPKNSDTVKRDFQVFSISRK